jgi:uncharacterized membrane protein
MNDCRPKLKMERTSLESWLDFCAVLLLAYVWVLLYMEWDFLPSKIPTHFGALGKPDNWGGKSSLWMLPMIGSALALLLTVVRHFPHLANYPWRITSDNAAVQYRIIRSMLSWLQLELVWIFAYLEWGTLQVAMGKTNGLNPAFLMLMLIAIFGTVTYYLIKSYQSK